jgi:hypothetical protein
VLPSADINKLKTLFADVLPHNVCLLHMANFTFHNLVSHLAFCHIPIPHNLSICDSHHTQDVQGVKVAIVS